MTRAYHIELTVLRDYGKQLILLGILVAALVSIGTRNLIIAPALMTCMFLVLAPHEHRSIRRIQQLGAPAADHAPLPT